MPRLTDSDYLHHRQLLTEAWVEEDFAYLQIVEQQELLDYYHPAEAFTDVEALAYRRAVTARHPELPQQAGRAFAHLVEIVETRTRDLPHPKAPVQLRRRKGPYTVRTAGLVRAKPDFDKLARVLLDVAKQNIATGKSKH